MRLLLREIYKWLYVSYIIYSHLSKSVYTTIKPYVIGSERMTATQYLHKCHLQKAVFLPGLRF